MEFEKKIEEREKHRFEVRVGGVNSSGKKNGSKCIWEEVHTFNNIKIMVTYNIHPKTTTNMVLFMCCLFSESRKFGLVI